MAEKMMMQTKNQRDIFNTPLRMSLSRNAKAILFRRVSVSGSSRLPNHPRDQRGHDQAEQSRNNVQSGILTVIFIVVVTSQANFHQDKNRPEEKHQAGNDRSDGRSARFLHRLNSNRQQHEDVGPIARDHQYFSK